jgi:murein DD-endopeptidase MepM/ murein hydrolase activator NlpD
MGTRLFVLLLLGLMLPGVSLANRLLVEGDFTQGGLAQGLTDPRAIVESDGNPVRVSKEGHFLIGFERDAPAESKLRVRFPDGQVEERTFTIAKREFQIQRIDGLPKRKVTPKKEDLERIRKEAEMAREARKLDADRTDFLTGFVWPAKGRISGVYGSQRILNGQPRRPHFGVDIAAPVGTEVRAPADGVVTMVHPDMFFSGGTMILDHGHGLSSSFLHLHRILVEKGQRVRQGDLIGEVGATGRVTGAHLDWRINLFTKRLDPQLLVIEAPGGVVK